MALHDFVDALNFLTGSKLLQVAFFHRFCIIMLEILYVYIQFLIIGNVQFI